MIAVGLSFRDGLSFAFVISVGLSLIGKLSFAVGISFGLSFAVGLSVAFVISVGRSCPLALIDGLSFSVANLVEMFCDFCWAFLSLSVDRWAFIFRSEFS